MHSRVRKEAWLGPVGLEPPQGVELKGKNIFPLISKKKLKAKYRIALNFLYKYVFVVYPRLD